MAVTRLSLAHKLVGEVEINPGVRGLRATSLGVNVETAVLLRTIELVSREYYEDL